MSPNPFQRKPRGPEMPQSPAPLDGPRAAQPDPGLESDGDELPAGNGVKLAMLGYRGPEMKCESCTHFDGTSACDLDATTPVDPDGGCAAYSAGGAPESDEQPMVEEPAGGEGDHEYR